MIQIPLNSSKQVALFIQRNNVLFSATSQYYGVVATSQASSKVKTFLVEDISASPSVYQLFNITPTGGTESLNSGIVKMSPAARWDYKIYPSTGSTVADINTDQLLEVGILVIS